MAASLARTLLILLSKLLLVDVMCSFTCDWLFYLLVGKRGIANSSVKFPSHKSSNSGSNGIQVIVCGFPRSGSTSLFQAMEILGFPCFHGVHCSKPTTSMLFIKAQTSGDHHDWRHLLHDYTAIADFPATSAYKTLIEVYPNAKVILNVRDPEKWYKSFSQTILQLRQCLEVQILPPCILRCDMFFQQKLLKGKPEDKELSIANYKLHIDDVKQHVPSQKLYVFELEKEEGWVPLCKFLEVPIPSVPFPFVNTKESFERDVTRKVRLIWRIVIVLYLALLLYAILYGWKWVFFLNNA